MRRRPVALLAVVALLVSAGACGLPDDDRPRIIAAEDAPLVIGSPEGASREAGGDNAELYLVDEQARLTIVRRPPSEDDLRGVIETLLAGPTPGERDIGLSTAIPPDTVLIDAVVQDGIATIDLGPAAPGGVGGVGGEVQRTAFAQLVLTAVEVEGVRAVRFLIEGVAVAVPTDVSPTQEPVSRDDYALLDPTIPPTTVPPPVTSAGNGATEPG